MNEKDIEWEYKKTKGTVAAIILLAIIVDTLYGILK